MLPARNGLVELRGTAPLFFKLDKKALSARVEMQPVPTINKKPGRQALNHLSCLIDINGIADLTDPP
jgi:hypothetical protein